MTSNESRRIADIENQLKLVEKFAVSGFWHALDAAYRVSTPDRRIKCIICGHAGKMSAFKTHLNRCAFGGGDLVRHGCRKCGCIFGPLKVLDLPEDFVNLDYRLLYSRYAEGDSTEGEILAFKSLQPKPTGLYLDWGCGGSWSNTISRLRAEGYIVWGYEPSTPSQGYVVQSTDEISAKFDGIFSNNVIEHFRDPISQFMYFADILKTGGSMVHQSPCYAFEYAETRFHTLFLLGDSPSVLAEKTGFRSERVPADRNSIAYLYTKK